MEHNQEERDLEDEISFMEKCVVQVRKDLESRMRDIEGAFEGALEDNSPSKTSTIKADFAHVLTPTAPPITDEENLYNSCNDYLSSSYPKLPMSDELVTLVNSTRIRHHNGNRLSLNLNAMGPTPRLFLPA